MGKWPLFILLVAALSGCTEKSANDANMTSAENITQTFPVHEPSTVYIEIVGSKFNPSELRITNGTTVRWTNMDSMQHVVEIDGIKSPPLNKREMWNYTFNKKGSLEFSCFLHPWLQKGRMVVD